MKKVIESKGDSIDAAVENALKLLGRERDDVSVEVLQKPKSGFLGFGREPAIVRVQYETSPGDKAKSFLEGLLLRFGTPAHVEMQEDPDSRNITFTLSGDNMGAVIGRRGDTLDAMQYLTSVVANRDEEERWRVSVDTENYRAKREGTLEALAAKTAQKALKYKKPVVLEPMNPHERRIIHTTLQGMEGISTYSTGSDPNRKVIVSPADIAPGKGNRQGGGSSSGGPNRRRKPRRKPANPGGPAAPRTGE